VKSCGRKGSHFLVEGVGGIILLGGSQASPARVSDKSRVKVNALGWFEAVV
jgi:hypothetical protein